MSKVARSLHSEDMYKAYCLRLKKTKSKPMDKELYMKMLETMGEVFSDELLDNGIVQLPWGLGDVYLRNKKGHGYNHKEKTITFNDHSEGIRKTFFWLSPERKSKKAKMWCFSPGRYLKRDLGSIMKTQNRQYPDFHKMLQMI